MNTIRLQPTDDILVGTQDNLGDVFTESPFVFKYEYAQGGKMLVVCFKNEKDILPYMKQYPNYWYDCIRTGVNVREFYDIDLHRDELPEGEFKTDEDITEYVVDTVLNTRNEMVDTIECLSGAITPRKNFMTLTAHNEKKISIHIINEVRHFENNKVQGDFMRRIYNRLHEQGCFFNIDTTVYSKNRAFRMLNQTKHGQDRPLKWFNRTTGGMLDASLVLLSLESRLIDWKVEEKVESKIEEYITTDLRGLDEFLRKYPYFEVDGKRLNRVLPSSCLCDPTDFHSKENMYIFRDESGVYVRCFCGKGQPLLIEKRKVQKTLLKPQKLKHSTMERHRIEQEEYERMLMENDMIIDCRMTGSGKTTNFMRFLETKRKLDINVSSLLLHHRQSLDQDYKIKYGQNEHIRLKSYRLDQKKDKNDVLSCVINSLYTVLNVELKKDCRDYDYICIDEIGSLLKQTSMDDMYFNMNELFNILQSFRKPLVMLDANLDDAYIDFILNLRREKQEEFKYQVITPDFTQIKQIPLTFYENKIEDFIVEKIIPHDFTKNKIIIPSTLSISRTNKFIELIKTKHPTLSVLYINKNNRDEYFKNNQLTTKELLKYDMIVYSPTISEGVSFDSEEFKHHIGYSLLCNTSASPFSANQMLKRFRSLRQMFVCYEPLPYTPRFETEEEYLKYCESCVKEIRRMTHHRVYNEGKYTFRIQKDEYWRLAWLNMYNDEYFKEKDRFKNVFLQLAVNNGYELFTDELTESINDADKEMLETIGERLGEEELKILQTLPLIPETTYAAIKHINTEENALLRLKYNIFRCACPYEIHQEKREYPNEFYKFWKHARHRTQLYNLRTLTLLTRTEGSALTLVSNIEQIHKGVYEKYNEENYGKQVQSLKSNDIKLSLLEEMCKCLGFKQIPDFSVLDYQTHSLKLSPSLYTRLSQIFRFYKHSPVKILTEIDGVLQTKQIFYPTNYNAYLHLKTEYKQKLLYELLKDTIGVDIQHQGRKVYMQTTLPITFTRDDKPAGYLLHGFITDDLYKQSEHFFNEKYYCRICEKELKYSPYSQKHQRSNGHREKLGLEQYKKCQNCKKTVLSSHLSSHNCQSVPTSEKQKTQYKCEKCDKLFKDKTDYTRHTKRKIPCSR